MKSHWDKFLGKINRRWTSVCTILNLLKYSRENDRKEALSIFYHFKVGHVYRPFSMLILSEYVQGNEVKASELMSIKM